MESMCLREHRLLCFFCPFVSGCVSMWTWVPKCSHTLLLWPHFFQDTLFPRLMAKPSVWYFMQFPVYEGQRLRQKVTHLEQMTNADSPRVNHGSGLNLLNQFHQIRSLWPWEMFMKYVNSVDVLKLIRGVCWFSGKSWKVCCKWKKRTLENHFQDPKVTTS